MLDSLHTNPTQLTGLLAFALSIAACLVAARRRGAPWRLFAMLQLGCFAEVLVGMRLRLHELVNDRLQSTGRYEVREAWQWALLAVLGLIAVLAFVAFLWSAAARGRATSGAGCRLAATLATGLVLLSFAVESVSLHRIDAVMYRQIGSVLLIGALWAAGALTVTAAALAAARR